MRFSIPRVVVNTGSSKFRRGNKDCLVELEPGRRLFRVRARLLFREAGLSALVGTWFVPISHGSAKKSTRLSYGQPATTQPAVRCFWTFPAGSLPRPKFWPSVEPKHMILRGFSRFLLGKKNFTLRFPARQGTGGGDANRPELSEACPRRRRGRRKTPMSSRPSCNNPSGR